MSHLVSIRLQFSKNGRCCVLDGIVNNRVNSCYLTSYSLFLNNYCDNHHSITRNAGSKYSRYIADCS